VTPDTQVPTITERDVKILAWLFDPEQERPDFSIEDRDETLQRTLAVMRSLSGRSVVVDTETLLACVPTTWLDPLLTGPDAVIGRYPYGGDDIENLLRAIRARITALASSTDKETAR
jgi:hypothetical protein